MTRRRIRSAATVAAVTVLLAGACESTRPLTTRAELSPESVPVVYGGGRRCRARVRISPEDWDRVISLFETPPASSHEERRRIATGIAMMERLAGEQTPIRYDLAKNEGCAEGVDGRLDCIDESTNTTIFLLLFQQHGFLHQHRVMTRLRRRPLVFDVHYSGQIQDETTGVCYAVDSWFRKNGELPYVQKAEDWQSNEDLPTVIE